MLKYFIILSLFVVGCQTPKLSLGIEQPDFLPKLAGKRVGLLVNQTSVINNQHLADYLVESGVNVKLIFAPEHGFRGEADAGADIHDDVDPKTGIKIYSIYGDNKRPSPELLKQVDVVVFDIQDVGCRFYTYISSMHYMMEACAEAGKQMIVLDRPNPNGAYIDGPIWEEKYKHFVGMHPIPILHGLTVGELALMINGEGWLRNNSRCDLTVVPMKNYHHEQPYSLPIKPSPNLPNDQAIKLYPSLCFFEATVASIGRGTNFPFQVIGYPKVELGSFGFTPRSTVGATDPVLKDQLCYGQYLGHVEEGGLNIDYIHRWYHNCKQYGIELINRPDWLDKLAGNSSLRIGLESNLTPSQIKSQWQSGLQQYRKLRQRYLLYP